ncbi:gamma-glutamyl hydrolase-like [Ostrinia nubilalis]|uniref:gamma-glutamyl hydrolase-like n=1 Tax=Ostrinia nubilalis TaxID=29057 RepID=UPI0030823C39
MASMALKSALLVVLACILHCEGAALPHDQASRPVVGILAQEQPLYLRNRFSEENYTSFIAASYVKNLQFSGANVIPIPIGRDRQFYKELMQKINGVILPGGEAPLRRSQINGYADAGQHIYELAMEMNDAGDYFPIFGECLGLQFLIVVASGRGEPQNKMRCHGFGNFPIYYADGFRNSKLFAGASDDVLDILKNEAVTVNAHKFCITDENLKAFNLTKDWLVSSYSDDIYGAKFIASIEHTRYPFYALQFHPEKIFFEWKLQRGYPRTETAMRASKYFMDFFVSECRKNTHSFINADEERSYLIDNYKPTFTGDLRIHYESYFFDPRGDVKNVNHF